MTIRERLEAEERQVLSPHAQQASAGKGRARVEGEGDDPDADELRTDFQSDLDRIVHCKSFRRLAHKTQVFLAPEGDHYRTRITHTLEVAQVARTIGRALGLHPHLTEAIAMGHDLGHTPFGHAGEAVLARLMPGGFHHARQSLRVVEQLERDGAGLNLTFEVRDGILKHSKGKGAIISDNPNLTAMTLEGQVVRVSDIIAYVNHDLDDALRAGLLTEQDVPAAIRGVLGESHGSRAHALVHAVVRGHAVRRAPRGEDGDGGARRADGAARLPVRPRLRQPAGARRIREGAAHPGRAVGALAPARRRVPRAMVAGRDPAGRGARSRGVRLPVGDDGPLCAAVVRGADPAPAVERVLGAIPLTRAVGDDARA